MGAPGHRVAVVDFTQWVDILSDPSVAVAGLFAAVIAGLTIGGIALAISLVSRAD